MLRMVISAILCGTIFAIGTVQARTEPVDNEGVLLRYLRPALTAGGYSLRVYYAGPCEDGSGGTFVGFPTVDVTPWRSGSALEKISGMLASNTDVTVMFSPDIDKTIDIHIGHPTLQLIKVPINVSLKPVSRYNAQEALDALVASRDMQNAVVSLGYKSYMLYRVHDHLLTYPDDESPHLPEEIRNLTFEHSLGMIARVFDGVVFYGVCMAPTGGKIFDVQFISI